MIEGHSSQDKFQMCSRSFTADGKRMGSHYQFYGDSKKLINPKSPRTSYWSRVSCKKL